MKKLLLTSTLLLFTACSSISFNYNGLQCPTSNLNTINADMETCHLYDLKDVDKAFRNDPKCQECLEEKGYHLSSDTTDNNASK